MGFFSVPPLYHVLFIRIHYITGGTETLELRIITYLEGHGRDDVDNKNPPNTGPTSVVHD